MSGPKTRHVKNRLILASGPTPYTGGRTEDPLDIRLIVIIFIYLRDIRLIVLVFTYLQGISCEFQIQKEYTGVYISVKKQIVSTRSCIMMWSPTVEKASAGDLKVQNPEIQARDPKIKYQVLNAMEDSDWIIDHNVI